MSASPLVRAAQRVLQTLVRDETLWTLSRGRALDRVLEVGLAGVGNHVATVWWFHDSGTEMLCIARRERERGYVKPFGRLLQSDYPAYFRALREESFVAADDALHDRRLTEMVEPYLKPNRVSALLDTNLRREGRLWGVLCFEQLGESRSWTDAERDFCAELAVVVNQLLLIDELRRTNKLLRLLNGIAPRLGQDHTVHDLARVALDTLREEFGDIWAAFFAVNDDGSAFELLRANARGMPEAILEKARTLPSASDTPLDRALSCRGILVESIDAGDALARRPLRDEAIALGVRTVIAIPLMQGSRRLGGIVIWLRDGTWIGEAELDAYRTIATTFSVAFANAVHIQQLNFRARHDALTGLANRDQLFEEIDLALSLDSSPLVLVLLDLREFRLINDTLGRGPADAVLVTVARRVSGVADSVSGCAFRLSGAEFALLFRRSGAWEPEAVAARLREAIAAPLQLGGLQLIVQAQCGAAVAPEDGTDATRLVRRADTALGWAKERDEGVAIYRADRDASGPRQLELLDELRRALAAGALSLHFQPKVALADGALRGCEALLRWTHPRFGPVRPDRLVAAAEAGNMMRELTLWVADAAAMQLAEFRAAGLDIPVAINASVQNLVDESFPSALEELLARRGVPADGIRLEITETVLMRDPERALPVMRRLAELGLALDIDDFGTGYSSLAYLRRMPLAALKIDRAFVQELLAHREDEVIVRSTVGLAHGLGLAVVAEGVEDAGTLARLCELGCDIAQGYHISRPLPAAEFIAWVRQRCAAPAGSG